MSHREVPTVWFNDLYKGPTTTFECRSLDDLGAALVKLRQTREWSQKDLAVRLGTEPQQVQRWERNDWQKISMWRLQEVVEILGLELDVRVRLKGRP